jgi:hypothetical protein
VFTGIILNAVLDFDKLNQGEQNLIGNNLKVVWTEFLIISWWTGNS